MVAYIDGHKEEFGIVRRGRKVNTTRADEKANRPPDLVERRVASRPNELWVTDLTYVPTWAGMVYVSFITRDCRA